MTWTWEGKRVLVTGGSGFLGRHVVQELRRRGAKEVVSPRSAHNNLVDRQAARKAIRHTNVAGKYDVVFHLAARVGGIGANRANPGLFLFENAMMGLNVIEECRRAEIPKLVIAGTICSYPKLTPVPFHEHDLWNGYPEETNAPYGIAKRLLLVQSQAYREQYGFNSIMLFPVNMYGPWDNFDLKTSHVIPAIVRKCIEARDRKLPTVTLWGDGRPTREFLYVEDCAEAMVIAAEQYNSSEPVNIGTGQEISIRDLATTIATITKFTGTFTWDSSQPNGQFRRCLDVSRAREQFGFTARTALVAGLIKTVDWYEGRS